MVGARASRRRAEVSSSFSGDDVGDQSILEAIDAILDRQLLLLQSLNGEVVAAGAFDQCGDREIEIAVLLAQMDEFTPNVFLFVFHHGLRPISFCRSHDDRSTGDTRIREDEVAASPRHRIDHREEKRDSCEAYAVTRKRAVEWNQLSLNMHRTIEKTSTTSRFAGFGKCHGTVARIWFCDMLTT